MENDQQVTQPRLKELSDEKKFMIASVDEAVSNFQCILDNLHAHTDVNRRRIAVAKTHLETAAMYAVKAIAQPE